MPLGESMITVLRNNKLLNLNRDNRFDYESVGERTVLDFSDLPKSTPETIRRIQGKINRENKIRKQKQLVLIGILSIILVSIFVFIML